MRDVLCPVLVGRDRELAAVAQAVEAAAGGSGGVLFVLGEAGIGKSRLAREAVALAEERGALVLKGRAVQRTSPAPYRPFAEALGSAPGQVPRTGGALRWLLSGPGEEDASEPADLAVAEALVAALATLDRPGGALVVLEDLHWADPETLAVVEYLADHLTGRAAMCLATVRTGENSAAERLAQVLYERRAASAVRLAPLPEHATQDMARACLGTDAVPVAVREYLNERTDGVPLFVEELLSGLVDTGALARSGQGWDVRQPLATVVPLTYAEVIRHRLDALPAADRDVVLMAAVLSRRFDWSLLPAAVARSESEVVDALRRATEHRLVEPDGDPAIFRFRHALGREAVLGHLLPPEQADLARRALDALEGAHPGVPGEWAELAADLAERAGDRHRAVGVLVEIGHRAVRRGALATARSALSRAEHLCGPHADLLITVREAQAHAAALAGDVDRAIRSAADALGGFGRIAGSEERRGRLHLALARAALAAGRTGDAGRHAADARSHLSAGTPALLAAVDALTAQIAMAAERVEEAGTFATRALDGAVEADASAVACEALEVLGRVARAHDLERSQALFEEALRIATHHDLSLWRARALHELGTIDLYAGRQSERFAEARQAAIAAGAPALVALCDLHLAAVATAGWDWRAGVDAGVRGADISRRLGLTTLGMTLVHLGSCYGLGNDEASMEAALDEAAAVGAHEQDVVAGIPGRARAALALRRADFERARAGLDEGIERARQPMISFPYRGLWALLHAVKDPHGAVAEAARREAAVAPGSAIVFNRVGLELAEAVAAGAAGRAVEARRRAEHVLRAGQLGASGPWEAILVGLTAEGAIRGGWGGRGAAGWARSALAIFESSELPELASWCRALLRDAGEAVPRRGRGTTAVPPGLRALGVTSREADVLLLLVEGIANREAAARLHLSPRTVERHISNLLAKTGAADRRDLARIARDAGLSG